MHWFARKSYLLYTICLTIVVGLVTFSFDTTYPSSPSIIISFPNVNKISNVTFDLQSCGIERRFSNKRYVEKFFKRDEIFNYLSFVLRSHSLFYCSVPKVATRTFLLFLTYLHIRDDLIPFLSNHSSFNHAALNQTIQSLFKNDSQFDSLRVLQFFSSQLRSVNSSKIDLWSMYQKGNFPLIRIRSLSNPLSIFSSKYLRVIFVRHPFQRLASAYIDKITSLDNQPFSLYDNIRRAICRKYSSFYLTVEQQKFYRIDQKLEEMIAEPCEKIIPSFEHFIEYLILDDIKHDVHWKPYSSLCRVCLLKYNFIGKFETIEDDLEKLIQHTGLNSNDWMKKDYFRNGKTKENYRLMYLNLNDRSLCYLKYFYRHDLKLFQYFIDDYLPINRTIQCSKIFFRRIF